LAALSPELEQQTVTCLSPSKTFNLAGLFTSQLVIPNEDHLKSFKKEMEKIHLSPNIFGVIASEAAYRDGGEWLDSLMDHLQGNINFVSTYLAENIPQIKLVPPEATYLLWLDFRELGIPDKELKKRVVEDAGLGFNEGRMFGPGGHGFQRMNVACPRKTVEQALVRLKSIFG
jgi:cystathionine beta-lyase